MVPRIRAEGQDRHSSTCWILLMTVRADQDEVHAESYIISRAVPSSSGVVARAYATAGVVPVAAPGSLVYASRGDPVPPGCRGGLRRRPAHTW